VQIIHRIIATILVIAGLFLTIISITTPADTGFSQTEVILSPTQVVWQVLTDPERMPVWQPGLTNVTVAGNVALSEGTILQVYSRRYDPGLYHKDKVIRLTPEKNLTLMRIKSEQNTMIRDYSQEYELKKLLDGTTEMTCRIFYRCPGFISRIYNRLYEQKVIENRSRDNIRRLKNYIEKI
jgi:uncharacterized membrane protein